SNTPVFDLSGQGNTSEGTLKCSVAVPAVHGQATPAKIKIPLLSFKAETFFKKTDTGIKNRAFCHLTAQNTNLNLNSINCKIPTLSLDGTWKENSGGTPQFDGSFRIKSGRVYDRKTKAQLRGINMLLPVKWPVGRTASRGNISVKTIQWENRDIGSIKGSMQQKGPELVFNAKLENTLFPGVSITSSGELKIVSDPNPETRIRYNISNDLSAPDIDWGQILPQAKGIKTQGKFSIAGIIEADANGIRHSLKADVINTQIRQKDADFSLEGMNMELFISDVPNLKSAPAQKLTFKKASFGNLDLTHGSFNFQIENKQSIFIEKSSFNWCEGNVNTQSFRLLPGIADYDIILHCDRLNLAMLLEQLGVGIAAGKGTVNGKIPLRFQNGKLSFDDAFLYSTPGAGGKIYLTGTEILTTGIPSNTPQYAQIELVREALKDFDYEWAKVKLLTEDENLLLKIQFDGKPATALPFVYKKEFGGFVRAEAGIKGSVFKGIRLDINLHLPLDKIMQYKNVYRLFF
ncbi:MAG: YdbH domain-containing protein, partial [Deltaproteobacteria bacterium]|nr:YdbH domain-containing protein [Deltaproteobacteria bacterium]